MLCSRSVRLFASNDRVRIRLRRNDRNISKGVKMYAVYFGSRNPLEVFRGSRPECHAMRKFLIKKYARRWALRHCEWTIAR